jgi:AcrR family transcriptional regulator
VYEVKARRYNSPLRLQQAAASRAAVLRAARELFLDQGYGATTIGQIAARAGASKPTVSTAVGNKQRLLKTVRDVAMAGTTTPRRHLSDPACRGRGTPRTSRPPWRRLTRTPAAQLLD